MNKKYSKTAIVTGASQGIGTAIAQHLALNEFNLIVNYLSNEAAANDIVKKINNAGGSAIAIKADVSDALAVKRMFDSAEAAFGGVDVLVNNAGIMKLAKLADSDDELIDSQISVNLKGTINPLREAATRLKNGGRIVNFSTSVVGLYLENYSIYAAIKSSIETLTKIMAKELRGRAITVNTVAPGPTATNLFLNGKPTEVIDRMSKASPLERLGTPEDIANVVTFLVSDDAGWINGQIIRANGGIV